MRRDRVIAPYRWGVKDDWCDRVILFILPNLLVNIGDGVYVARSDLKSISVKILNMYQ